VNFTLYVIDALADDDVKYRITCVVFEPAVNVPNAALVVNEAYSVSKPLTVSWVVRITEV